MFHSGNRSVTKSDTALRQSPVRAALPGGAG